MLRLRLAVIACAAVALAPAGALAKPKVAVLGLEVVESGPADPKATAAATAAAKALTKELREEAAKDGGKFELAPDSAKDLLELKLLSDCSDEGRKCMAEIGKELKADFLLYGKIEKQKLDYQVSLKLLDTSSASMVMTTSAAVPQAEATGAGASRWAQSLYARLTGAPQEGALVVRANVDGGSVYVDGDLKTNLADGSARVTGLSEGVHRITIQTDGYARHDAEVTIAAGEETEIEATLVALDGSRDPVEPGAERPGGGWRAAFWVAAGATAVGATAWTIEAYKYSGFWGLTSAPLKEDHLEAVDDLNRLLGATGEPQLLPDDDACSGAEAYEASADGDLRSAAVAVGKACDRGRFHANMTTVLGVATGVTAVATAFFYYKGYVQPKASSVAERQAARKKKKPSAPVVRFAPSVSPTAIGAGVALEF